MNTSSRARRRSPARPEMPVAHSPSALISPRLLPTGCPFQVLVIQLPARFDDPAAQDALLERMGRHCVPLEVGYAVGRQRSGQRGQRIGPPAGARTNPRGGRHEGRQRGPWMASLWIPGSVSKAALTRLLKALAVDDANAQWTPLPPEACMPLDPVQEAWLSQLVQRFEAIQEHLFRLKA